MNLAPPNLFLLNISFSIKMSDFDPLSRHAQWCAKVKGGTRSKMFGLAFWKIPPPHAVSCSQNYKHVRNPGPTCYFLETLPYLSSRDIGQWTPPSWNTAGFHPTLAWVVPSPLPFFFATLSHLFTVYLSAEHAFIPWFVGPAPPPTRSFFRSLAYPLTL